MELYSFFLKLIDTFSQFGSWLNTDLGIGFTPLNIISVAGITFLIGVIVVNIVIPG